MGTQTSSEERPTRADRSRRQRSPAGVADRAYEHLRLQVLSGSLGLGERLREDQVAHELSVSRTPVREALLRLYGEGLVERHRDGGFVPRVPNLVAIQQLYELRVPLEESGLLRPRQTGVRHDPAIIGALQESWHAMADVPPEPGHEQVLADEEFHLELARASGNLQLVHLLRNVFLTVRPVRVRNAHSEEAVRRLIEAHIPIVDAVADDDLDLALALFRDHLRGATAILENRVGSALVHMALGLH